jgi:queuine tRNA-ribosyltransferase
MGIGRPEDSTDAIGRGIDLFDCVLPTRNGRHGLLFTSEGLLRLRNQRYRDDPRPVDPACDCPGCRHYSRAYLRHLHQIDEMLGARLGALHNLRFYLRRLQDARAAIRDARFAAFRAQVHELASRSPS